MPSRPSSAQATAWLRCLCEASAARLELRDGDGLKAECEQGRDLGFDGKTLIHPAQIEIANTAFAPTNSEIELAERQIAAYEESRASGQGIAVVDGQIVENLHIVAAQRILDRAQAIRDMAAE